MPSRVLSVNIGLPRDVDIKGRTVSTAIFKSAVDGPHWVDTRGIRGDGRVAPRKLVEADHAVHIYPYEHYAHWERLLGRGAFPYGQFGENLTTTGILETHVRVGDVLRIGSTTLQVVYPRIPCRKLDARMEQPGFKRTFLQSRRVGFYLRVLQAGRIAAGDAVELVTSDPDSPSLDTFTRVSQFDYWDVEGLEHLVEARGLSQEWLRVLSDKLDRARKAEGWFGTRELEITGKRDEGESAASLELRCARGRPLPRFLPGQDLTLMLRAGESKTSERRALPLTSDPDTPSVYRAAVGLRDGGPVDEHLRHLDRGDTVRALAPSGAFTLGSVPPSCTRLVLLADGFGIASFVGIARALSRTGAAIPAALLHRAVGRAFGGFLHETERIAASMKGFEIRPLDDGTSALSSLAFDPGTHVLVAGSHSFLEDCGTRLKELEVEPGRLQLKHTA